MRPTRSRPRESLALAHGLYYVLTGLWPIISMRSFEAVTGPKRDGWLVRMVGLLAVVIGLAVLRGRERPDPILAVGAPLAFAAIDATYVARGRISRVYLAEAAAELAFAVAHLVARLGSTSKSPVRILSAGPT
jgi:hypothetical protein